MSEETFSDLIKKSGQQIHDEFMKNNLKNDPQWRKVRFNDIKKKHHVETACLTKEPPKVSFTIWQSCFLSNYFEYVGNPAQKCWDFEKCSMRSENFMYDLLDAGIITEEGEVNYEVLCGVDNK